MRDIILGIKPSRKVYELELIESAKLGYIEAYYLLGRMEERRNCTLALRYYRQMGNNKKAIRRINKIKNKG